jgi:hypothetical protein
MFNKKRALLFVSSLTLTFIGLRLYLVFAPDTDFNVGAYNIHHLYTGLLLVTAAGVPLILFNRDNRRFDFATLAFGSGLGMALDEWVYLIATDGSNASYLLPISFWGGVILITLTVVYVGGLMFWANKHQDHSPTTDSNRYTES